MKRKHWIALGLLSGLLGTRMAGAAALDTQLLVNPGAEDGMAADAVGVVPIPGWDTAGTSFTAARYSSPAFKFTDAERMTIGGGGAFFAGGPNNPASQASQEVDVSSLASDIDAGGVNAMLGAEITGYATEPDNGTVTAVFLDAGRNPVGSTITLGPQGGNNSQWVQYQNGAPVPPGTRSIVVSMFAERVAFVYNDAYFDNLSLVLTKSALPAPTPAPGTRAVPLGRELLVNGDADAGPASYTGYDAEPMPGWTVSGNFTAIQYGGPPPPGLDEAARIGGGTSLFTAGGITGAGSASQMVDLSAYAPDIDAGNLRLHLSAQMATGTVNNNQADAYVEQLDSSGQVLDTLDANPVQNSGLAMVARVREAPIRAGARYARVVLTGGPFAFAAFFDNVSLKLAAAPPLPAPIAAAAGPAPVSYGANLLADPGAEDARPGLGYRVTPIPGWTSTGSFTTVNYLTFAPRGVILPPQTLDRRAAGTAISGGDRTFAGGPSSNIGAVATAAQTIDVSGYAGDIDAGLVTAHAEAQIAGYQEEGDNGMVVVTFLDGALKALGTATLGPVHGSDPSSSSYTLQKADAPVPPGTRSIQYMMVAQKLERLLSGFFGFGLSDDVFFDNLVLSLNVGTSHLPGDVNGDGVVDVGDATLALRAALGLVVLQPDQVSRADVTGDGGVTVADATAILQKVVAALLLIPAEPMMPPMMPPVMPPVMPPMMPPDIGPPAFSATATAAPDTVASGSQVSITATFSNTGMAYTGITDIEIYDAAGNKVAQQFWKDQALAPGVPLTFKYDWTASVPPGVYSVQLGIFNPEFTDNPYYNNNAATVTVTTPNGM